MFLHGCDSKYEFKEGKFLNVSVLYLSCEWPPQTQVCVWLTPPSSAVCCPLAGSRTPPAYVPPSRHLPHSPEIKDISTEWDLAKYFYAIVSIPYQAVCHLFNMSSYISCKTLDKLEITFLQRMKDHTWTVSVHMPEAVSFFYLFHQQCVQ